MSDTEAVVAILSTALTFGTIITIVRMWLNRHRSSTPPVHLEPLMDRLQRIEQSLDSVAVEVERISEGQRFATKLLAERAKEPAMADQRGGRIGG